MRDPDASRHLSGLLYHREISHDLDIWDTTSNTIGQHGKDASIRGRSKVLDLFLLS